MLAGEAQAAGPIGAERLRQIMRDAYGL